MPTAVACEYVGLVMPSEIEVDFSVEFIGLGWKRPGYSQCIEEKCLWPGSKERDVLDELNPILPEPVGAVVVVYSCMTLCCSSMIGTALFGIF